MARKSDSPCNGCKDRCQICHAQCERYFKWSKARKEELAARKRVKDRTMDADSFAIEKTGRMRQR